MQAPVRRGRRSSRRRRSIDAAGRTLRGIATLAAVVGQFEIAARLFAAAEVDYEAFGAQRALPERTGFEQVLTAVKEQLSPELFATAWAAGSAMSPPEALVCINAVPQAARDSPARGSDHRSRHRRPDRP